MKTYSLGNHGFVREAVRQALALPSHVQQADVIIVAASKAAAARLLAAVNGPRVSPSDPNFTVDDGDDVRALREAGLLDLGPAVYAHPMTSAGPVVQLLDGGAVRLVGTLKHRTKGLGWEFVPVDLPEHGQYGEMTLDEFTSTVAARLLLDTFAATELVRECAGTVTDDAGKFDPARLVLTPAGVAALLQAVNEQAANDRDQEEEVLWRLTQNKARVAAVNKELEFLRLDRQKLCRQAVELNIVPGAAKALGVGDSRVYQLKDAALVAEADQRRKATGQTCGWRYPRAVNVGDRVCVLPAGHDLRTQLHHDGKAGESGWTEIGSLPPRDYAAQVND